MPRASGLLDPWTRTPASAAVLTDYDGTLAPIVDDPASAVPLAEATVVLAAAAARLGLVAVVSGRPVRFLLARLGPAAGELVLVGLYGLERAERGRIVARPEAERWRPVVAEAVGRVRRDAPAWLAIEDKGLTVTLHARREPAMVPALGAMAEQLASGLGLVAQPGRMSVELRPPVSVDKGTVVEELTEGYRAACFIGDDAGDLPAFAALRRRREEGVVTLAVAAASAEAPAELLAEADLVVDGPEGALGLLRKMAFA